MYRFYVSRSRFLRSLPFSRRFVSMHSIFVRSPPTCYALLPFVAPPTPRYALSRFSSSMEDDLERERALPSSATRVRRRWSERRNYGNKGTEQQTWLAEVQRNKRLLAEKNQPRTLLSTRLRSSVSGCLYDRNNKKINSQWVSYDFTIR